ncbi:MAG: hypothetical protein ACYCTE_15895 [Acidimicrobiales bacterium]
MPADEATGRPARDWGHVLDEMESYVRRVRASLEHGAPMPGATAPALPDAQLPPPLAPRARVLLAAQRDVEVALRERVGILGAAMRRDPLAQRAAISLYLDRTA